jgi:dTDP-glucose pyrophosphorylase
MAGNDKVKVAVIPAAGQGKRMGYLSFILPKPLLPIYDKPLIHHILENIRKNEIEEVYIIVYYQKEKIIEYINTFKSDLGPATIKFIELEQPSKGIAHTISFAEQYITEPFMVILGDDFTITPSFYNLIKLFFKKNAVAVEGVVKEKSIEALKSTCCLKLDKDKRIIEIIEKPDVPITNIRGIGVYIFSPEIFDYIKQTQVSPPRNEIEITNTIKLVAKKGKAYAEFIRGINININTPEDLFKAWIYYKKFKNKNTL